MRALSALLMIPLLLTLASGCANTDKPKYDHIEPPEESEDSSPEQLYERTAALFSRPENLGLEFYSPSFYASALDALEDAETALNGLHESTISPVRALIASRKLLERAQETRNKVDRNLKELVTHRNLLIELNAPKWQTKAWESVSGEIKDLMLLIEDDEIKAAINQEPNVRKDMYALEVNTLLSSALDQARITLQKAERADADKFSPALFNSADILIDDTEIYIRSNFRDRKGIAEQAENARLEAERAYKTALDSKHLLSLNEEEIERYLINLKEKINSIVQITKEELLQPSTVDEALTRLFSIVESKQTTEDPDITASETTVSDNEFIPNEDADIQVLQVLDSLYLEDSSSENLDTEVESKEQTFDDIEYID
jgi:hypothetical protein